MRQANAMCRLMALAAVIESETPAARVPHIREVRRHARSLLGSRSPATRALAEMALAQVDAFEDRREAAQRRLHNARRALGRQGEAMAIRIRYLEGLVEGGPLGARKCAQAVEDLAEQGWANPQRALAVGVPLARVLRERIET